MRDIKDLIAEVYGVVWANDTQIKNLERLVELARAEEREACAKLCDGLADIHAKMNQWDSHKTAETLAQAIRAKGDKHD